MWLLRVARRRLLVRGFISFFFCVLGFWSDCWLLGGTAGADIKEMQNKQCMSLGLPPYRVC